MEEPGSDETLAAEREREAIREAYARGRVEFMGIDLLVGSGALVPRSETALLGRTALQMLASTPGAQRRVVDMCCGAGNLACAIAFHEPAARVWACDMGEACVALTARNAGLHRLESRVSVHRGDLFGALDGLGLEGTIDVVVCNPPYISEARLRGDRAHLLELEPADAFAAGPYGISFHMRVISAAGAFLKPGGTLLMEIGLKQDRQVVKLFERSGAYEGVTAVTDTQGNARVVHGTRRSDV